MPIFNEMSGLPLPLALRVALIGKADCHDDRALSFIDGLQSLIARAFCAAVGTILLIAGANEVRVGTFCSAIETLLSGARVLSRGAEASCLAVGAFLRITEVGELGGRAFLPDGRHFSIRRRHSELGGRRYLLHSRGFPGFRRNDAVRRCGYEDRRSQNRRCRFCAMLDEYSGGKWMTMQRWLIAAAITCVAATGCSEAPDGKTVCITRRRQQAGPTNPLVTAGQPSTRCAR